MCGIIGIFGNENAANLATLGLFAEQHRGQESCGMDILYMDWIKEVKPADYCYACFDGRYPVI